MTKEKWFEFRKLQKNGYCNMLDKNCMQEHIDFTDLEHKEYITKYIELKDKFENNKKED